MGFHAVAMTANTPMIKNLATFRMAKVYSAALDLTT
jgi:hypothetical protein